MKRARKDPKAIRLTISFKPDVWRVIREAAHLWRQRINLFARLAVEFRAADVLNSVPTIPLKPRDRATFRRIWDRSRDPGRLRKADKEDWSA
jgi:uncharacterized protein (DUF1778 family)